MTAKRLPHNLFSPDSVLKCISFVSALPPELYRFKTSISIGRANCVHRIFFLSMVAHCVQLKIHPVKINNTASESRTFHTV